MRKTTEQDGGEGGYKEEVGEGGEDIGSEYKGNPNRE